MFEDYDKRVREEHAQQDLNKFLAEWKVNWAKNVDLETRTFLRPVPYIKND